MVSKRRGQFEKYAADRITEIGQRLTAVMRMELEKLHKQYPNRRLWFADAMGSTTIYIEVRGQGRWTSYNEGGHFLNIEYEEAWKGKLADHIDLIKWYREQADEFRVSADELVIGQKQLRQIEL